MLIPQSTVDQMKSGSVIVDLASSSGGNCELSQDNKTISYRGVTIVGNSNLPALLPQDASFLYANNVVNFLNLLVTDGQLNIDLGNEIIRGAYITAEQ